MLSLLHAFIWLQLLLKVEQALSSTAPAPAADPAAAATPDAPASSPGQAATGAAAAQRLPWLEDQPLPLAELLGLLYWLQQHAVRLQLAPGAAADLYMDPDLEVYAAVRVPTLSMQSRPTLIGGEASRQRQGRLHRLCSSPISFYGGCMWVHTEQAESLLNMAFCLYWCTPPCQYWYMQVAFVCPFCMQTLTTPCGWCTTAAWTSPTASSSSRSRARQRQSTAPAWRQHPTVTAASAAQRLACLGWDLRD